MHRWLRNLMVGSGERRGRLGLPGSSGDGRHLCSCAISRRAAAPRTVGHRNAAAPRLRRGRRGKRPAGWPGACLSAYNLTNH